MLMFRFEGDLCVFVIGFGFFGGHGRNDQAKKKKEPPHRNLFKVMTSLCSSSFPPLPRPPKKKHILPLVPCLAGCAHRYYFIYVHRHLRHAILARKRACIMPEDYRQQQKEWNKSGSKKQTNPANRGRGENVA
jgi:hypothetical protein